MWLVHIIEPISFNISMPVLSHSKLAPGAITTVIKLSTRLLVALFYTTAFSVITYKYCGTRISMDIDQAF